jgi:uncharacterized protein (DUF58 family)
MNDNTKTDGITWLSANSMIQLRQRAKQLPLSSGKIHARQGGAYMSSFKGRGMEFDEVRLYMPGDDIRNMDWRVTARTGEAHTKVYREERERPVLIWLDLNPSMMFATRGAFKAVVASKVAALLAWSTADNNDRLGALVFAGDEHTEIRPRRGKYAVLDLIGRIAKHPAWSQHDTQRDMPAAISRLRKVARPGSLVFMISDFRELNEHAERHIANTARHSDIIMIHISDPIESSLPGKGQYQVSDGRNIIRLNAADRNFSSKYHRKYSSRLQHLQTFCRQHRIYLLQLSTSMSSDQDILTALQTGLGMRANLNSQFRSA